MIPAINGGKDPGAVGLVTEKDVNLAIAKAAKKRLLSLGHKVEMTRDGDYTVSLEDRVFIANTAKADVFVSIHANAGGGTGFESFRARDDALPFQQAIHQEIRKLGVVDRGLKKADFYVLQHTNAPAVLVECLFVDHAEDVKLLTDPAFIAKMGCALADAVTAEQEEGDVFKDVLPGTWYEGPIKLAAELGLMGGYPDGTFKPNQPVTRAELASVTVRNYFLTYEEERINTVIRNCSPAVATVYAGRGGGSGFFVADKLLVTNAHVVAGANTVTVATRQGKFTGEVERRGVIFNDKMEVVWAERNVAVDLATVRITKKAEDAAVWGDGFPIVKFAGSAPDDGDWMVIIGSPLLIQDWKSLGIVSRQTDYFINTDAAINPGNSGGAAFNLNGHLVGVPTYKYSGPAIDSMGGIIKSQAVRLWLDGKHDQIKF